MSRGRDALQSSSKILKALPNTIATLAINNITITIIMPIRMIMEPRRVVFRRSGTWKEVCLEERISAAAAAAIVATTAAVYGHRRRRTTTFDGHSAAATTITVKVPAAASDAYPWPAEWCAPR